MKRFKKKNNCFLLGLSIFLIGGGVIINQPQEADANITCGTGIMCTSGIENQMINGHQAQVLGRVSGVRSGFNLNAGAGIRLGNRSTGTTTANGTSVVTARSAWLNDYNTTSDIAVFGHVR